MDKQNYYENLKAKMEEEVKQSEYMVQVHHRLTELYQERLEIYKTNNFSKPEYIEIFKEIVGSYEIIFEDNFNKATKLSKKISKKEAFINSIDEDDLLMDIEDDFQLDNDRDELDNIFSDMESDVENLQEELQQIKDMRLLSREEALSLSSKIKKLENIKDKVENMCY